MSGRQEGLRSPGWGYFAKSSFDNVLSLPKVEPQHTSPKREFSLVLSIQNKLAFQLQSEVFEEFSSCSE